MPENEIKKTPVEQLQMNAVSVPEPPAVIPAATPAQRPQSYAEKVQGLTADERIWPAYMERQELQGADRQQR